MRKWKTSSHQTPWSMATRKHFLCFLIMNWPFRPFAKVVIIKNHSKQPGPCSQSRSLWTYTLTMALQYVESPHTLTSSDLQVVNAECHPRALQYKEMTKWTMHVPSPSTSKWKSLIRSSSNSFTGRWQWSVSPKTCITNRDIWCSSASIRAMGSCFPKQNSIELSIHTRRTLFSECMASVIKIMLGSHEF